MKTLQKKIKALIKISKGVSLLDKQKRAHLLEMLAESSQEDLENLYEILNEEREFVEKLDEDFNKKCLAGLREYYAAVKTSFVRVKKEALVSKENKAARAEKKALKNILSKLDEA